MKTKGLAVLIAVVLVAGGLWATAGDRPGEVKVAGEVALTLPGEQKTVRPDHTPPDFFIIREGEEPVTLAGLRGRYVFINFWNTWCPPCRGEMPDLERFYREYRDENVEFLFINITAQEKSVRDVNAFLAESKYSLPVYLDRQGEVARAYGIRGIPTTLVIDPAGEIIYAAAGPVSYEKAKSLIGG